MAAVAVLGYGVVGAGVGIICREQRETIRRRRGIDLNVKYVLDLRDFPDDPYADKIVHDPEIIFSDPEVSMVIETIGGTGAAYDYTKRALEAGKHVITSNKELVAAHGAELLKLAAEHKVFYLFEAAVGGGIPVLVSMREHLASNDIYAIDGILNGTCNYILSKMRKEGKAFQDALAEAQERGYAERDPSDDVGGADTARKLAILASMCIGEWVDPEKILTEGIANITQRDIETAEALGDKIVLLATLRNKGAYEEPKLELRVAPVLLPEEHPAACADDVFNAVFIRSYPLDDVMLYGRGAGSLPTANAIVGDMMEASTVPWTPGAAEIWQAPSPGRLEEAGDLTVSAVLRIKKDFDKQALNTYLHDLNGFRFLESPFADEYLIETDSEQLREGRLKSAVKQLPEGSLLQILRRI